MIVGALLVFWCLLALHFRCNELSARIDLRPLPVAPPFPVLPQPSPALVARATRAHEQAVLEAQLRQLDATLGIAFGLARIDPSTGRYVFPVEKRWLS